MVDFARYKASRECLDDFFVKVVGDSSVSIDTEAGGICILLSNRGEVDPGNVPCVLRLLLINESG